MDNIASVGVRSYYYGVMAAVWDLTTQLAAKQIVEPWSRNIRNDDNLGLQWQPPYKAKSRQLEAGLLSFISSRWIPGQGGQLEAVPYPTKPDQSLVACAVIVLLFYKSVSSRQNRSLLSRTWVSSILESPSVSPLGSNFLDPKTSLFKQPLSQRIRIVCSI